MVNHGAIANVSAAIEPFRKEKGIRVSADFELANPWLTALLVSHNRTDRGVFHHAMQA
jgi:hypothetical protein